MALWTGSDYRLGHLEFHEIALELVNQFGSWAEANKAMAEAFEKKGYDHQFVFGEGSHSARHGTMLFPDAMRWMWRDYPKD